MTVTNIYAPVRTAGNGSKTSFSFSFKAQDANSLVVNLVSAAGVKALQTITTHYTVTIDTVNEGGTIEMVTAPAISVAEDLLIEQSVAVTQPTDFPAVGNISKEQLENEFDRRAHIEQEINEKLDRVILNPVETDTGASFNYDLPTPVANRALIYNATADALITSDADFTDLNSAAAGAAASAAAAAADLVLTNADVVLTNADVVLTNADVVTTTADAAAAAASASAAQASVQGLDVEAISTPDDTVKVLAGFFRATDGLTYINVAETVTGTFASASSGTVTRYYLVTVNKTTGAIATSQFNEVTSAGSDPYDDTPQPTAGTFALASVAVDETGTPAIINSEITDLRNRFFTALEADEIAFDNTGTALAATEIQAAVVELDERVTMGTFQYAANGSPTTTVAHGLGKTPRSMQFIMADETSVFNDVGSQSNIFKLYSGSPAGGGNWEGTCTIWATNGQMRCTQGGILWNFALDGDLVNTRYANSLSVDATNFSFGMTTSGTMSDTSSITVKWIAKS
jgi:hypothetical protein